MRHSTLDQENHINKQILKQTTHFFQYINSVIIVINQMFHLELFNSITKHNNNKKNLCTKKLSKGTLQLD